MELSSSMIIDIALNAAGYIAAGILSVTIYSMFTRRQVISGKATVPSRKTATEHPPTREAVTDKNFQFVDFAGAQPEVNKSEEATHQVPAATGRGRKDRADIIRVAREMLKAGASADRIQKVLPISEAELTLLGYQEH